MLEPTQVTQDLRATGTTVARKFWCQLRWAPARPLRSHACGDAMHFTVPGRVAIGSVTEPHLEAWTLDPFPLVAVRDSAFLLSPARWNRRGRIFPGAATPPTC